MATKSENEIPIIPLDPTKWAEPITKGIGRIIKCRFATTDDAMGRPGSENEGMTFTEMRGWPRAGRTWELDILRLDAVWKNKDTSEITEMHRFQTVDLERFNEREHKMMPVLNGNNKAKYIVDKCVAAHMRLSPDPTVMEGAVVEYEVLASKNFGGPNPAKNLLYITRILAKAGEEYEYRGDVDEVEFDPNREGGSGSGMSLDDAASAISSGGAKSNGKSASKAASSVLDKAGVFALMVGMSYDETEGGDFSDLVADHKGDFDAATKTGLLTGAFASDAIENGELVVVDGVLAIAQS